MVEIRGSKFIDGGEEIGWLEGQDIYNREGKVLAHFENEAIYTPYGQKLGYLAGEYFFFAKKEKISLEKLKELVPGSGGSDLIRGGVLVVFGQTK